MVLFRQNIKERAEIHHYFSQNVYIYILVTLHNCFFSNLFLYESAHSARRLNIALFLWLLLLTKMTWCGQKSTERSSEFLFSTFFPGSWLRKLREKFNKKSFPYSFSPTWRAYEISLFSQSEDRIWGPVKTSVKDELQKQEQETRNENLSENL